MELMRIRKSGWIAILLSVLSTGHPLFKEIMKRKCRKLDADICDFEF